uniref:Translocon-associated protein subunit beta n=1 Tax=Ditylenchus dipsaci TaxID=166011 RepID=A0A915D9P1_9BILA
MIFIRSLCILSLFLLSSLASDEAKEATNGAGKPIMDSARILASKFSLSQYAVENMDYVIEYSLYNVGDRTALKVTLDDRMSFPTQSFEIVKGLLNVRWEKIPPGGNVTHSVWFAHVASGLSITRLPRLLITQGRRQRSESWIHYCSWRGCNLSPERL